jgi:hypothetical protein
MTNPNPTPEPESEAAWIERQRRVREEHEREQREIRERREKDFEKSAARMRAHKVDDGTGHCKWCGCVLTFDSDNRPMHADNGCAGPPPPPCATCQKPLAFVNARWVETCTPAEHQAAASLRAQVQRIRSRDAGTDPLSRARARRISDDE